MNWLWNYNSEKQYRWISLLIVFKDEKTTILDKGFVFLGDLPIHYLSNYLNFTNFTVINNKLYYFYKSLGTAMEIDPGSVFIHIKFGKAPFKITSENLDYWNLFFSSTKNKIYMSISNFLNNKYIKMIDEHFEHIPSKKRLTHENVVHPFFKKKEIYGANLEHVVLSDLDISLL